MSRTRSITDIVSRILSLEIVRFATVGAIGTGVNLLVLYLTQALNPIVAVIIAIEAAAVSNFVMNDRWTFRGEKTIKNPIARFAAYDAQSLGTKVVNVAIYSALLLTVLRNRYLAEIIAIAAVFILNYAIARNVAFRRRA